VNCTDPSPICVDFTIVTNLDTTGTAFDINAILEALTDGLGVSLEVFVVTGPVISADGKSATYHIHICSNENIDATTVGTDLQGAQGHSLEDVQINQVCSGTSCPESSVSAASRISPLWF